MSATRAGEAGPSGSASPGEASSSRPGSSPGEASHADRRQRPIVIGLTGPIGCGKSTIARMLAELGGTVLDADTVAREVTAPGEPALAAIRDRFGEEVFQPSGVLDREALAAIVFDDPAALADLERIVHPHVRTRIEAALERAARDGDPFVAVEAIKLIEGGLAERCDEVWLITCPPSIQRGRLLARGMPGEDIERRLSAQGSDLAERMASHAHRRIDTSGDHETIRECVEDALADLLAPGFAGLPWGPVERP